ncbi:hypothetical protein LIA77_00972 [Sarocladium implicatum]|nr:hypothetical protein LIA77_00972 [Sarocladium implicatum]
MYNQPDKERDAVVELFQSYLRHSGLPSSQRLYDGVFELEFHDENVMMFQEKFFPNWYHSPVEERVNAIRQGAFTDVAMCRTFRLLLCRNGQILASDVRASTETKASLLHSAAVCMGRRYGEEATPYKKPFLYRRIYGSSWGSEWRDWASDVARVSTCRDWHAIETLVPPEPFRIPAWTGTPLISMLGAMLCWLCPTQPRELWDRALEMALREWLRALQGGGIDLLDYGQRERSVMLGNDVWKAAFDADATRASATMVRPTVAPRTMWISALGPTRGRTYPWVPIRLVNIEIGVEPEDWRLFWASEFEYLASEFWDMIERRASTMPGSWVE